MTTLEQIRRFVIEESRWDRPPEDLTADVPLVEQRILDSIGLLHLVMFLEEQFGLSIDDRDITTANLGTLSSIEAFVSRKRTPPGGPPAAG